MPSQDVVYGFVGTIAFYSIFVTIFMAVNFGIGVLKPTDRGEED